MTLELTYTPASPSAGDALTFTATGEAPSGSRIVVTADGDEKQASPAFGQENQPEGTGSDRYTLQIVGGTVGTFTLGVYQYGDAPVITDPIYYYNDSPTYTYPDSSSVVTALEAALPGLEVTATRSGSTMTILLGGKYSGKDMQVKLDTATIAGNETITIVDAAQQAGPFTWGPVVLPADVYTVDVLDDTDASLLSAAQTITIT